jgi:hypothetical protein
MSDTEFSAYCVIGSIIGCGLIIIMAVLINA